MFRVVFKHKWLFIFVFLAISATIVGAFVELSHRDRLGRCYDSAGTFFNSRFIRELHTDRKWVVVRQINLDRANRYCEAEYAKRTKQSEWVYGTAGFIYLITVLLMIPYLWRFILRRIAELSKAIKGH